MIEFRKYLDIINESLEEFHYVKSFVPENHPNSIMTWYENESGPEHFERLDPDWKLIAVWYNRLTDGGYVSIGNHVRLPIRKDFDNSIDMQKYLNQFGIILNKGKGYIK